MCSSDLASRRIYHDGWFASAPGPREPWVGGIPNGNVVAQGQVPAAISLHFTGNATFDIGTDLDSPVSLEYYDQSPFAFNGTIGTTKIKYLKE